MKTKFWIRSAKFDTLWFVFPQLIPAILVFFLPSNFLNNQRTEIFPISWLLIVLCIDVAHVYSTVYKTYFLPEGRLKHRFKLMFFPVLVWMGGILIYSISSKLFWTCLAYFAVYHFIRQQYGFFRLYSKSEASTKLNAIILNTTIYAVTLIPILIWHCEGQRNFNWMLEGDFVYFNWPQLTFLLNVILLLIVFLYLLVEYKESQMHEKWNFPRMFLTFSTGFAWYVCIVLTNNDFVFSLVNVIGHGIPYLALVWITEKKEGYKQPTNFLQFIYSKWGWILFYLIVFLMAYFEEALWDIYIWRENAQIFGWGYFVDQIDSDIILAFFIPLLIMPQVVHYILDAYIWKRKKS
jgi:hypothetical protein